MIQSGIDSSVLVALLDAKDKWHLTAVALKDALQRYHAEIAIFDVALAESISTISRRMREQKRMTEFTRILTTFRDAYPAAGILWTMPDVPTLYAEILEMIASSNGDLNFNDALIAISCRNHNLRYLASFDVDFDQLDWLQRIGDSKVVESIISHLS